MKLRKTIKLALLVIVTLIVTIFANVQIVSADNDDNIDLKAEAGFNGEYKPFGWVPVNITISNNSGNDIEGMLIVGVQTNYNSTTKYQQNVAVAKNTTKKITMYISGNDINYLPYLKLTYKDSTGNSKEKTANIYGTKHNDNTILIGALAENTDTGMFLEYLPVRQLNAVPQVIQLNEEDIPNKPALLKGISVLIINNYAADKLTEEQIQAIVDWTKQGGLLVLSGGAGYQKVFEPFTAISPVKITGITKTTSLAGIEKETNKQLNLDLPVTITQAEVINGKAILNEGDLPLFVMNKVDAGNVLYVAYDLAAEPLAGWTGNKELWSNIFLKLNVSNPINNNEDWWSLREAVNAFPSLKLPNLTFLISFTAIYILLIGPIFYFILRKRDKLLWNWLLIPGFSLMIGFAILQVGLINRTNNVLVHHVSFMDVKENRADLYTVSAIFAPESSDYQINFNQVDNLKPISESNKDIDVMVSLKNDDANITLNNIEFWSYGKVFSQKTLINTGYIESNVVYDNGKLKGTITNKTNYHLKDIKITDGNNVQDIGNLAPGQNAKVDITYYNTSNFNKYGIYSEKLLPKHLSTQHNKHYSREFNMLRVFDSKQFIDIKGPIIVAWTEDPIVEAKVVNQSQEDYHLTLIKSDLSIKPGDNGNIFVPANSINSIINSSNVKIQDFDDGYRISMGTITFDFYLKDVGYNYDIKKIYFNLWSHDNINSFERKVYNWQSKEFEPFTNLVKNNTLDVENINDYVSDKGILRLEIANTKNNELHLGIPGVSVEGKLIEE